MKIMCGNICNDTRTHFYEKTIFTLDLLKNLGEEVLKICHPGVNKIVLNMIKYYDGDDEFIITRGSNSMTSNATRFLERMESSCKILKAYFTVFLEASSEIKFGIKLPDKPEVVTAYRPFIYDIVEEMGLMDEALHSTRSAKKSLCELLENVWDEKLSRQELLFFGIDINAFIWGNFFGKSATSANYYFCSKCSNRHALIATEDGFTAIDERDECPIEYKISQKDLDAFTFKQKKFFVICRNLYLIWTVMQKTLMTLY